MASLSFADLEPDDALSIEASDEQEQLPESEDEIPSAEPPLEDLAFGDFEADDPLADFPEIEPSIESEPSIELEPAPELEPASESQPSLEIEPSLEVEAEQDFLPEPGPVPVLQTDSIPEPAFPTEFEPEPEVNLDPVEEAHPEPQPAIEVTEADSAESLFASPEVPQSVEEISSKLGKLKEEPSQPDILQNLLKSESPLQKKKPLPDDDILKSLLKPNPPRTQTQQSEPEKAPAADIDPDDEEPYDFPSEETVSRAPQSGSTDPTRKASKPSFIKRAWKFFWPFGGDENNYLTPVTISGEVFIEGEDANSTDPVEVILFFPSQNMRVVLQLKDQETQYFYSGNFAGNEPPLVSVRVQKKGYFPAKISRVKLLASEDGFKAELNPIELLSR